MCLGSSDEVLPGGDDAPSPQQPQKAVTSAQRSNTSVHVCWHRGASLGLDDQLRAVEVHIDLSNHSKQTYLYIICHISESTEWFSAEKIQE